MQNEEQKAEQPTEAGMAQNPLLADVLKSLIDEFTADYRKYEAEGSANDDFDYRKGKSEGQCLAYADVVHKMRKALENIG